MTIAVSNQQKKSQFQDGSINTHGSFEVRQRNEGLNSRLVRLIQAVTDKEVAVKNVSIPGWFD